MNARRRFAASLWRLADLTQASERRRSFRAKAYRQAVWSLDSLSPDLGAEQQELLATPGIGPGVASLIDEFKAEGRIRRLEALEQAYPREASHLGRLPRMTPAILQELKRGLGVDTRADLVAAIESGAALTVHGVGDATLRLWMDILGLAPDPHSAPAHEAWALTVTLAAHLEHHVDCRTLIAGDVRRLEEWGRAIDLVAVTASPHDVAAFVADTAVLAEASKIDTSSMAGVTHSGLAVEVVIAPPEAAGGALVAATGPPEHVALLPTGGEFPSEPDVYRAARTAWIPPPARHLPASTAQQVVRVADVRGDLHLHTEASPDGHMSLQEILAAAEHRDYEYLLITDHTRGLRFGGLGPEELRHQATQIASLGHPACMVLHGAEVNIGRDGDLDLDHDTLSELDIVVAGLHSDFGLDRREQTARLVRAVSHPAVRVLAHPLGRRIGIRPPIEVDVEAVIEAAMEHSVALEVNGHRDRLDLPAHWVQIAHEAGATFAASSDAHRIPELSNVENAVGILQRAGVINDAVVNTLPTQRFLAWTRRES